MQKTSLEYLLREKHLRIGFGEVELFFVDNAFVVFEGDERCERAETLDLAVEGLLRRLDGTNGAARVS